MRIFFSVGEPSGDLHGSNLIRRLKSQQADVECVGFGGPKMAAEGCQLQYDLTSLAVMFIGEALKHIRLFFKLIDQANTYFENNHVDAVVLIDYPGFNWWIARKAKKHGIPVFYYGVPQMWAWAPWRVRKIQRYVDHVLCKLPFEVDWFAARNCQATYVGHPYFDQLQQQTYDEDLIAEMTRDGKRLLTLLPGSRDQEVRNVLPILLNAAKRTQAEVPDCRVVVACYNERQRKIASDLVGPSGVDCELYVDKTPELMKSAHVCLACSGSVSLELLHHRKPTVIVFKVKRWVMVAQAIFLRVKFITLVNLIASKDIRKKTWAPIDPDAAGTEPILMPEYLTIGDPSERVARRVSNWLNDEPSYQETVSQLDSVAARFALAGATERAADYILGQLTEVRLGQKQSGTCASVDSPSGVPCPTDRNAA